MEEEEKERRQTAYQGGIHARVTKLHFLENELNGRQGEKIKVYFLRAFLRIARSQPCYANNTIIIYGRNGHVTSVIKRGLDCVNPTGEQHCCPEAVSLPGEGKRGEGGGGSSFFSERVSGVGLLLLPY